MSKLYVDNIASKTGGTDAITIDSSGRILTPARPAFRAYAANTVSIGNSAIVQFGNEDFDIGGNYNASTSVFTAPVSGLYSFSINLSYYIDGDTRQIEGRLRVNGAVVQTADSFIQRTSNNNTHTTIAFTTILNLTANDTVDVQHSSVATITSYAAIYRTVFSGHLIG